ncbi:ABC-type transport auxiliary lipoprotein family protein [Variovorax sp. J22P240]|uniref:ABC-type transport auxiliary lipoprotein family protein n=1 Tax=unclassified Variovorax TaxID=663243 RepID=UPI002575EAC1|nr:MULTISPECIES: ABC-type transport auxiliary lipoprotein family protein [unclassified Variovorax]MDM0002456.1 ABC-type transport auxiliary lipoprotein family protein [Variovorax sp. J22P240]MDM0053335.1 ABC-type transport auxiliary lipoprotein family protein [Variovorax sp. J22R115]
MYDALKNFATGASWARLSGLGGVVVLLLATGCGALPDKPARATLYDFGPGAASSAPASIAPKPALPPIALAEIDATSRLDGTQMLYRLGYADANELRPYGQSRWSQAPAQLVRQRVREALAVGHTVLGPEESATIARTEGRVPDTLRLSLEEFSHFFESPTSSAGLVRISATLIRSNPGGDRVLAQRTFTAQRPAPSNDAPGGVKALAAASDAVAADLVAWVDQIR